ncbi:hypothetical protein ACLQ2R_13285 [Streptosporangium sp. DT93]|uniref:hypothetical protein n=1 Tax=Streptosporangium sp. DT93 TaxID=3393428 RepID=UPI003CF63721
MVTLVLFALGVIWIGGRIDVAVAGERAGTQAPFRIAAHVDDTPRQGAATLT